MPAPLPRRRILALLPLLFAAWGSTAAAEGRSAPPPTGQLLVHFQAEPDEPAALAFAARHGLRFLALAGIDHAALFSCLPHDSAPPSDCREEIRALADEPEVRLAYPNRRLQRRARDLPRTGKSILTDSAFKLLSEADLMLSAREREEPATIDTPFIIEVSLQNRGPATARDIAVRLTPPASFTFDGAIGANCVTAAAITCPVDALSPGESASLQLRLSGARAGDFTSQLSVTSATGDPRMENNSLSLTTRIQDDNAADAADLWLALAATPSPAILGETLEYRITVNNRGAAVGGATLTLTRDSGLSVEGLSSGAATCNQQALSCQLASLESQHGTTIYLRGKPTRGGELSLTAEVASSAGDANPSDNRRSLILSTLERIVWNDPKFGEQWHLYNQNNIWGDEEIDINVMPAWQRGLFGEGVTLAVVDDGLELAHEDLRANTSAVLSWDYNSDDNDPSHNNHGTAVAGLIGARAGNGIGVVGVAPRVTLAGIRAEGVTDYQEALALNHRLGEIDIYNNSWGPEDGGTSLDGPGPLTVAALEKGVTQGRGGKGVIYCWAAGNGGVHDHSNFDGYANSRYTLAFGAHSDLGFQAYYSETGANLMATAPSDSGFFSITTTDRSGSRGYDNEGNYTSDFGGTSAATPIACGVTALVLNANPALGWRDVHYIIAASAYRIDASDGDWRRNGAGHWVNHNYGFGAIDADAASALAEQWLNLGAEIRASAARSPNLAIPDNAPEGITSRVTIDRDLYIESVEIAFSASDHPYWGDLRIVLTSPDGTESMLAPSHDSGRFSDYYDDWTFLSKRHLGENARGTWSLKVADMGAGDSGTLESWQLTVYGTAQPPFIPHTGGPVDLQASGTLRDSGSERTELRLRARNNGPGDASNVSIALTPPEGVRIVSLSGGQDSDCYLTSSPGCSLPSLAANEEREIVATLEPPVDAIEVEVSTANPDLNPANDRTRIANTRALPSAPSPHHSLSLAVSGGALGRVSADIQALDCRDNCLISAERGTRITLQAHPLGAFSAFDGWFGACQGSGPCTITLTDDLQLEARFRLNLPGLFHWVTSD